MSLRIGPRKALGLAALVVVAAVAMAVWRAVGTDGLLLMAILTSVGAALAVAWFMLQAERRTMRRLEEMRQHFARGLQGLTTQIEQVGSSTNELASRITWDGERADRFLTALDGRLSRTELLLEMIADRLK